MRAQFFPLLLILPLVFWSCGDSKETVTGDAPDLVPVQIDLVMGFGQKEVRLDLDGKEIYWAYPSGYSSYSGPQASFSTYMERDSRLLSVWWKDISGNTAKQDSVFLHLDNVSRYYLYLTIMPADTLQVAAQDHPILYLKNAAKSIRPPR